MVTMIQSDVQKPPSETHPQNLVRIPPPGLKEKKYTLSTVLGTMSQLFSNLWSKRSNAKKSLIIFWSRARGQEEMQDFVSGFKIPAKIRVQHASKKFILITTKNTNVPSQVQGVGQNPLRFWFGHCCFFSPNIADGFALWNRHAQHSRSFSQQLREKHFRLFSDFTSHILSGVGSKTPMLGVLFRILQGVFLRLIYWRQSCSSVPCIDCQQGISSWRHSEGCLAYFTYPWVPTHSNTDK